MRAMFSLAKFLGDVPRTQVQRVSAAVYSFIDLALHLSLSPWKRALPDHTTDSRRQFCWLDFTTPILGIREVLKYGTRCREIT